MGRTAYATNISVEQANQTQHYEKHIVLFIAAVLEGGLVSA